MKTFFGVFISAALVTSVWASDKDSHWEKAYPAAAPGMVRYVLHLPEQKDEPSLKVELIVGKNMETDGVNSYFLGGKIGEETVEGWGYTRYVVSKVGPAGSTLIGVDPSRPKVTKFVTLGGGPYLIRYNSKLPVMVYVPDGVEVRYRVWTAEPEAKAVEKG